MNTLMRDKAETILELLDQLIEEDRQANADINYWGPGDKDLAAARASMAAYLTGICPAPHAHPSGYPYDDPYARPATFTRDLVPPKSNSTSQIMEAAAESEDRRKGRKEAIDLLRIDHPNLATILEQDRALHRYNELLGLEGSSELIALLTFLTSIEQQDQLTYTLTAKIPHTLGIHILLPLLPNLPLCLHHHSPAGNTVHTLTIDHLSIDALDPASSHRIMEVTVKTDHRLPANILGTVWHS